MKKNNTKNVKIQVVPCKPRKWDDFETITEMGCNHTKIKYTKRKTLCHIKVLPGGYYKNLKTGEVLPMNRREEGKKQHRLRKTFEDLRCLIRTNFTNDGQNQIMLTLTYARFENNPTNAYDDFKNFWKRLRWHLPNHKLDYISVIEPQGTGKWHFHVMIKSDQKELWIDKWRIKEIWGHGNAYIERLKSDDVGAYYVSYFTHLYNESTTSKSCANTYEEAMAELANEDVHDPENPRRMNLLKKKIKGARLIYYPKDTKFYSCSRGITRPTVTKTIHLDAMAMEHEGELGSLVYSRTVQIINAEGQELNEIQTRYYKKNGTYKTRKKKPTDP
jgi:hypothetical protein